MELQNRETTMTKISVAVLLATAWALAAPVHAQDVSTSAEVPAEVSAPSVEISTEPSAEPSAEASAEASAPQSAAASFDIDAGLDIAIDADQIAQIRSFVAEAGVQPVNVDFDVKIGTTVPSTVTLALLPAPVLQLIPGFEGYLFFVLPDGRIAIVSPTTLKIVLIVYA